MNKSCKERSKGCSADEHPLYAYQLEQGDETMILLAKLEPDCFYWATRKGDRNAKAQIVQVSTIFGAEPEYWTVACLGSEEHRMLADFEFIVRIVPPSSKFAVDLAAE